MKINAQTKPTFILGNPVSHSKSPLMHNAAFEKIGRNAAYLALEVAPEAFDTVAGGLKQLDILGMNITIPYKIRIMDHLDELHEDAVKVQSVNTVVASGRKWKGHNTDWYGVTKTLENHSIDSTKPALLIGAGGAANGVVYGLQKYGFSNIAITNRTMSKAEKIAGHFGIHLVDFAGYKESAEDYGLIINCTTLDFDTLFESFDGDKTYFDLKYYSKDLQLPNFINGSQMLLYQGAMAFELWTGEKAPLDVMKKALGL